MSDPSTSDAFRPSVKWQPEGGITITTTAATVLPAHLQSRDAFKIPKGTTWTAVVSWKGDDEIDLTSSTATFRVKASPDATANLLQLTEASGITLGSGNRNIILEMTSVQTAALNFVRAWAVLTVTTAGVVTRLLEGPVDLVT